MNLTIINHIITININHILTVYINHNGRSTTNQLTHIGDRFLSQKHRGHWQNFHPLPRGAKTLADNAVECVKAMAREDGPEESLTFLSATMEK